MTTLDIHFLDVGQGDGTFIVFPGETKTMLVDLGSKKNADIAGHDAITFITNELQRLRLTTIDYLFVTHGDGDHYNLLPNLLARIPNLKFTNCYIGGEDSHYNSTFKNTVLPKCTNHYYFTSGAHDAINAPQWQVAGVKIYLLGANNPSASGRTVTNSSSLVLMLEYAGVKVILTGDAEDNVENVIINTNYASNRNFLKSQILKLGHHGSKNATSDAWINAVQPLAVFSSADMKWNHPYCEVFSRFKINMNQNGWDGNVKHLTSLPQYLHPFICGIDPNTDYVNNSNIATAIFTNIYYMHNDGHQKGLALGTQYRLEINDQGQMAVNDLQKSSNWFSK